MPGEEIVETLVTESGLLGDRAFALIDAETGKVASAKNPRRWPNLFDFQAGYAEPPVDASRMPPARILLPDGRAVTTDQADIDAALSAAVGRPVRLARAAMEGATAEGYWPEYDWLPRPDEVFEFPLPPGTFFDGATVHLLTTATLERLSSVAPSSRFELPRFRPNLVVEVADGASGFVEDEWIGGTVEAGEVRLRIDGPCPRCVMTTLRQADLPKDPDVLRTAARENGANVGVYASVVQAGTVRRGDPVRVS
jgi:uncharacterized protein YcbX